MSQQERAADEITVPVKRTEGETLEERMTGNAYQNILPARYLRKDADGNLVEPQDDLFKRVAENVALAEAVFEAEQRGDEITVRPDQLKPNHPRRDELASEVFGAGTTADDDVETHLSVYNVNKFAYETVVPELPEEIREHVEGVAEEFQESMEHLSFIPNSPTLMNAGDELQQLSACFVDSPDDDLTDIHQTAKEAAEVFQCLTDDTKVFVEDRGIVSIADVEPGDAIRQRDGDEYRTQNVEEIHAYDEAPTKTIRTEGGIELTGTPNHRLLVNDEWKEIGDITPDDTVTIRLNWIPDTDNTKELSSVEVGPQWQANRTVSNEAIATLHAEGLSDYAIAEQLDSSSSTIQYRRSDELGLPPNGSGGRKKGRDFDEKEFERLYEAEYTDSQIAAELGVHSTTVRGFRSAQSLPPNGKPAKSVTQPSQLTEDLAELLGYWIGDGSVHQDGMRFHVSREEVLEHIDCISRRLFDTGMDWTWKEGCYEAVIHSHEIKRWWLENFGEAKRSSADAAIPNCIWQADHNRIHAFLRGLFTADGALNRDKYPRLYSASERLIDEAHQLLLGIGIPSKKWTWDTDDREYFTVAPTGKRGLEQYSSSIGFLDERTEVMAKKIAKGETRQTKCGTLTNETTWEQEIVAVSNASEQTVYDVTIPDNPEYIASSIVSHNSGGGMGYAFWQLRPYGDPVGSTGGIASGPITFMRTYDQLCETIAQGGTRRGAQMGVMRVSHPDAIEFIHSKNKDVSLAHTLRLNDPDDYTYTSFEQALEEARGLIDEDGRVPKHLRNAVEGHLSNFNISVGVTDDFMEALYEDEEFTFTNPRTGEPHIATAETKEMYARYGLGEYVEVDEELSIPAELLWDRVVEGAHENGEPGVIYLERVNKEHSFDVEENPDHRILATNPCVTGETVIRLADGTECTVEELASNDDATEVLCRNAETDQIVAKAGRDPRKTRSDAEVIRVQTEVGASLVCTPDHEIWTPSGYVPAGELDAGDEIVGSTSVETRDFLTETLTVAYTESAGEADVYNITVDEHHNYLCRTEGDEGYLSVANCGEQPLEEYEACNLGHINLSTIAAFDAPDWRVWSAEHGGEYDSEEAAIEAYLEEAIDFEEFDRRIELGTRFLEDVVTMSDFPVREIEEKVRELRKIGLGIMGLAQLYIQIGVRYGSDTGNEIIRQLMMYINHQSKQTSHELALERGSFDDWTDSKYANPTEYREWFEHHTGESADDWNDGFPIRNHNTTTIAPTGTTSMLGNTTGGCEPIYNVAYYKNVSDDVQGDEMLVEFDDYFLRVLEANDIDPESVKAEAQEQMANNAFDGVSSLSTVPEAISELFVVTADITAKEHAAVQCASQAGVDSAISKTVNAPNDSTMEDAKEVFEYIYDHGGKGVTYYRDGTRSKQVLTTRADNAEFADEREAAAAITEQISEVFGDIGDFLGSEEVKDELDEDIEELFADRNQSRAGDAYARERPRPDVLHGVTQRVETGYGKIYVNINEDENGKPFELFATIGNSGGFTASFTEGLAKTISYALRSGVDPREIAKDLQGIRSPKVAWDKGEQINSIPDAIGVAMRRYLDDEIDRPYPRQQQLTELTEIEDTETQSQSESATDPGPNTDVGQDPETDGGATTGDTQSLIDAGESPECPDCGSMTLYFSEGCKTCESCGWSEC